MLREEGAIRVTVANTPVRIKPAVLFNLLALWVLCSWLAGQRQPERSWLERLLVGSLIVLSAAWADFGHAVAHIFSARRAGAPMDEVLISAGMPRTVYHDDRVPPAVHRTRALGGPVFSAASLLASLLLRTAAPGGTVARELADWSCIANGFILGAALMPLPFVDGGAILKWTLVERGLTEVQADACVERASLAVGAAAMVMGLMMGARRRWSPAAGFVVAGMVAVGAALGRIR